MYKQKQFTFKYVTLINKESEIKIITKITSIGNMGNFSLFNNKKLEK